MKPKKNINSFSVLRDVLSLPAGRHNVGGVPEGYDALVLSHLVCNETVSDVVHICRDDVRLAALATEVRTVTKGLAKVIEIPAWDCVPYDRSSPDSAIAARRVEALSQLAGPPFCQPRITLATVSSITQRVPPRLLLNGALFRLQAGHPLNSDALMGYCLRNGYTRSSQVVEPGDYAVRGGLIDLYPPGANIALRLDLFGDEIESIRTFDPLTQCSVGTLEEAVLRPVSEVLLTDDTIARFRGRYRELFGTPDRRDDVYEAVSSGKRVRGIEHWLPLFYRELETLLTWMPEAVVTLDSGVDQAWEARSALIREYFEARLHFKETATRDEGVTHHPVSPELMFLTPDAFGDLLASHRCLSFSPFPVPDVGVACFDLCGQVNHNFADVRARQGENVYDAVCTYIRSEQQERRQVIIAGRSLGSVERLVALLRSHGCDRIRQVESWLDIEAEDAKAVCAVVVPFERGFRFPDFSVITEQDILGDRLSRPTSRRKKKADAFLRDVSALAEGDLVVHVEHGIGRYQGLETVDVSEAPHDCLSVAYEGGGKLLVPVENIDVLSRYGSESAGVALDRLGHPAWQARKAKLKERIRDMADELIRIAALRQVRQADVLTPPEGAFDDFCARFPYTETEDQLSAIADVLDDLAKGQPMDRLVCGDVGFGKTEVALRAAFIAVMGGAQVAVVVPTTLLARQHALTFSERFRGFPVHVAPLSRLVSPKDAAKARDGLKNGTVDIVIGTHALLSKSVEFQRLGLLVIDEEQHFGVAHKEQLKALKADVHVLTLSATPIPRTLQLALTGVRELSLIASPPVDRLAVRTFVLPFDSVVIREAILRERYRGGQVFFVCPRLSDIDQAVDRLKKLIPEVRLVVAHGQMPSRQLEEVMVSFAEGEYDLLVATNIIESGLDMPRVNTIVIHRADMFGLSQLYQLRGRVGRSKQRGYAYLTLPTHRVLAPAAEKRLHVMQTLDTLGAGFSLASHDMDIRGTGNLLGDEQSGHIKEVGIELYQNLLQEAVEAAQNRDFDGSLHMYDRHWAPQINLGIPVLIPDHYVKDLSLRLSLYRRIASLEMQDDVHVLREELIDRFGPLPDEVKNLLELVVIKCFCRHACIEKLDAGPKGAVLAFRLNKFPNPTGLVRFIHENVALVKVRPDHKIVYMQHWGEAARRVTGALGIVQQLAEIAREEGVCDSVQ